MRSDRDESHGIFCVHSGAHPVYLGHLHEERHGNQGTLMLFICSFSTQGSLTSLEPPEGHVAC